MHCNWARFKPQLELEFEFEQLTCPEQLKLATATLFSQLATRNSRLATQTRIASKAPNSNNPVLLPLRSKSAAEKTGQDRTAA